jgi:hypothetical protein
VGFHASFNLFLYDGYPQNIIRTFFSLCTSFSLSQRHLDLHPQTYHHEFIVLPTMLLLLTNIILTSNNHTSY